MAHDDDGVTLARAIVAHFGERRHQPLLTSEKTLLDAARALIAKALNEPAK
jgi:hypothetical protein